jgi:hypothetical protein
MNLYKENQPLDGLPWTEQAGTILSDLIQCTLRIPQSKLYTRNFVCKHGILFPFAELQHSDNWAWAKEKHEGAQ